MQNEKAYTKAAGYMRKHKAIKLGTIEGERNVLRNMLEELNRERERKEVMFSRQHTEAQLAMDQLLKEEEEEAKKAVAVGNAQKHKTKGR